MPLIGVRSPQIASLINLRVLYLHNAFHRTAVIKAEQWEALRALRRLAFLSISGNHLTALPPAVADMSHLRVGGLSLPGGWAAGAWWQVVRVEWVGGQHYG